MELCSNIDQIHHEVLLEVVIKEINNAAEVKIEPLGEAHPDSTECLERKGCRMLQKVPNLALKCRQNHRNGR